MKMILLMLTFCTALVVGDALAGRPRSGTDVVNLPYTVRDSTGNQWMIYQGGWMQQRGNIPVYGQSAMLQINGNAINQPNNQAKIDQQTGEVVFENININVPGITATRRIGLDEREGLLRYIDIFRNTTAQEQSINYMVQSNLNYGIASSQFITEPGGKQRPLGWAAATPAGRGAVELFAGRGAKVIPQLNWQPNSNFIQAQVQLTIPANKEVAFMHVHATCATPEIGMQQMAKLKDSRLLAGVSAEIRSIIVNFSGGAGYIGDREILRGDVLDIVELHGGDQLKGTIKAPTLKLTTFYGQIELSTEKILGLVNVGQFRPRQLVISSDGEVFGGRLDKDAIEIELSSGQLTQVPLSQITRVGWRKRTGESEDEAVPSTQPGKPRLFLRSGDRIAVALPQQPIDVATRYGSIKVSPEMVSAIDFASEDVGVHKIYLTDGSRFAGLITGESFPFQLIGGAGGQSVTFPAAALSRLQIVGEEPGEPDEMSATVELSNGDLLAGSIAGSLKLDTTFDTLTVNGAEIRSLTRDNSGSMDVQIELWDQSRLSGQLQQQELTCQLAGGLAFKVPVLMVQRYDQPAPKPSEAMVEKIKKLVAELSADEWKDRERAESQLAAIGPGVIGVLKQMRPDVGPEAQQRIDSILSTIESRKPKAPAPVIVPGEDE